MKNVRRDISFDLLITTYQPSTSSEQHMCALEHQYKAMYSIEGVQMLALKMPLKMLK